MNRAARRAAQRGRNRRKASDIELNVWRSAAALIENDSTLSPGAYRILASMVTDALGADPADPDETVATLRQLHDLGMISIEDGVAYPSRPEVRPDGEIVRHRETSGAVSTPFGTPASSGAYHTDDATLLPTRWLYDRRLSPGARGTLITIASFRDGELPTIDRLLGCGKDPRATVEHHLAELDRVGYLVRHDDGRIGIQDASLRVVA